MATQESAFSDAISCESGKGVCDCKEGIPAAVTTPAATETAMILQMLEAVGSVPIEQTSTIFPEEKPSTSPQLTRPEPLLDLVIPKAPEPPVYSETMDIPPLLDDPSLPPSLEP